MLFDPLRHCYQYCLPSVVNHYSFDLTLAQTEKSAGRGKYYSDMSFQTDTVFLIDDRRIKKIVVVAEVVAAVLQDVEMNTHCYCYWDERRNCHTVSWSGPSHYGNCDHCEAWCSESSAIIVWTTQPLFQLHCKLLQQQPHFIFTLQS